MESIEEQISELSLNVTVPDILRALNDKLNKFDEWRLATNTSIRELSDKLNETNARLDRLEVERRKTSDDEPVEPWGSLRV